MTHVRAVGAALAALVYFVGASAAQPSGQPAGIQWLDEVAEVPYVLAGALAAGANGKPAVRVIISSEGETPGLTLEVRDGRASFLKLDGDKQQPIGVGGKMPPIGEEPVEISLHRHGWRLFFIVGNRVVARAWARAEAGRKERVGWLALGQGQVEDLRIQPLGEIYAADSFMRPTSAAGGWETGRGKWQQRALREDKQASAMDPERTTNPFSYYGEKGGDEGPAVAVIGYWFWTNYAIQAAVRGGPDSVVGLVTCYQDADNYLAVRWTSAVARGEPPSLQLLEVANGQRNILASERLGFLPNQWYSLRLGYCDGHLVCWVDGHRRLGAYTPMFGQGQAGLLSDGSEGAFFDDVLIRDWQMVRDPFAHSQPGLWQFHGGQWRVAGGLLKAPSQGSAMAVMGDPAWRRYSAAALIRGCAKRAGLVLGAEAEPSALIALQQAQGQARLAVLARAGGDEWQEIAAAPCPWPKSGTRLVASVEDGVVEGICNGVLVQAFVPGLVGGRVGLLADGASGLAFDDFAVEFSEPPRSAHLVKEMTEIRQHFEMAEWASRRHAWVPAGAEATGTKLVSGSVPPARSGKWWTKGDYFGDYLLHVPLPKPGSQDFSMAIRLDADPAVEGSGITVSIAGKKGSSAVTVGVATGGEAVAEKEVSVQADEAALVCRRRGKLMVVVLGGQLVFGGPLLPKKPPPAETKSGQEGEAK